ncbi:Ig-like domain-containing protein [Lutispora thermophila]|mgnify:CR=1 FL=1|uniref:Ig-like domain-containing protein n=1 Tax=Lutispora thermophila DSM 19022 TaxID=1122184 RepID=A0A1M6C1I5_9FIRM|nr:Ig-like domain-containing protein [Lutispora thermophila]SHI54594.1 Ig-like domain-containing protein [Lutispora thermophila DSM 19022]
MSKKIIALVLAIAMAFSTLTVAFADQAVSAEVQALAAVGMLEGDGNGVTVEYTQKQMDRFTAAISILKLKGLYEDALAFNGEANFADAKDVKWEAGKNVLAYIKANPQIGFAGDPTTGKFNPYANIDEQSYIKVLLETLGYKQTTAEIAGDFAWEETIEFAATIGLNATKANPFTIDALSKLTVSAFKAEMKDGKLLIEALIEAGRVDREVAAAHGLVSELEVAVKSAKALGNSVVEVTFDGAVNAAAEDKSLYTIEGLTVKEAIVAGENVVRLTTDAMTAGKVYTLTVGEVKVNFAGLAKVTGTPSLTKVEGTDTERVELTFDKVLDFVTATNVANYEIAGVKIVKAEVDKDIVTLVTEGLAAQKTYTIKVSNIASVDGAVLKSASKSFFSKIDKVAPKLEGVAAKTFTRLEATFSELLSKESAIDLANYTIKAGSNGELGILSIRDITESDATKTTVEITTAAQKTGVRYELIVKNVADRAVVPNVMVKEGKATFSGKAEDKTAPTFAGFEFISKNLVKVDFTEQGYSRLDESTALDANNYSFNNDVTIEKVEKLPGDKEDFRSVLITVSDLDAKTYKLTVSGIKDEYGNEIKETGKAKTFSPKNVVAAQVEKVWASDVNEIKVLFTKDMNKEVLQDITKYSIDGNIGAPVEAKYSISAKTLTLKTGSDLTAGKTYKITITGLKDLAGFEVNAKPTFVGVSKANDIEAPVVESIEALNNKVVKVVFSEPMQVPANITDLKLTVETGKTMSAKVAYNDNTTFEFSFDDSKVLEDKEYKDTLAFVGTYKDVAGNVLDTTSENSLMEFYGDSYAPDKITLDSFEQTSVKSFKLIFSDRVKLSTVSATGLTASYAKVDGKEVKNEVILTSASALKLGKEFKVDLSKVESIHGIGVEYGDDKDLVLVADLEDEEVPYIEKVEATYRDEIKVTYNEDLAYAGKYEITYYDNNGKEQKITTSKVVFEDNIVTITPSRILENGVVYTLKVVAGVKDLAGNEGEKDVEYSFDGTNAVRVGNYVTVNIVNGTKIEVIPYKALEDGSYDITIVYGDNVELYKGSVTVNDTNNNKSKVVITLADDEALLADTTYTLTFGDYTCKFNGIVEDDITVTVNGDNIEVSYNGMKAKDLITVVGVSTDYEVKATDVENGYAQFTKPSAKANIYIVRDNVVLYFVTFDPAE